jgi:hypothetical protein
MSRVIFGNDDVRRPVWVCAGERPNLRRKLAGLRFVNCPGLLTRPPLLRRALELSEP